MSTRSGKVGITYQSDDYGRKAVLKRQVNRLKLCNKPLKKKQKLLIQHFDDNRMMMNNAMIIWPPTAIK
jgi:hypothetical protein